MAVDASLINVALMFLAALALAVPLTLWHIFRFERRERARKAAERDKHM
jgi:hypothetical protein